MKSIAVISPGGNLETSGEAFLHVDPCEPFIFILLTGKRWIYLERYILHRQHAGYLRK